MYTAKQIDYIKAKCSFSEAESRGYQMLLGNINTNFWLHKEKINLDFVLEIAKRFSDSKIFIISEGHDKGFYIYSEAKKTCLKLVEESQKITHAVIA